VTDSKTGFCLGDRYRTRGRALPAQPSEPRYTGRCGLGETGRLRLVEGISVGYGDDYPANLEGQFVRLTGLPAGQYVLIHKVNVQRRLREAAYGNNAASLLLRLRWRAGVPKIRVLRSCPDAERCPRR
jgi:Lysyl oxidase